MFWKGSTATEGLSGSDNPGPDCDHVRANAINAQRLRDVFELLLTHVADIDLELALDLLVGVFGKTDRAGGCQRFDASSNIDAIAIDVAFIDDDVADVDADAKFDPAIFGNGCVALGHGTLDINRTACGIDGAGKFDQRAVACGFDDAAAMLGNLGIDHFFSMCLERCECGFLVPAHQAAVPPRPENSSQPLSTLTPSESRSEHTVGWWLSRRIDVRLGQSQPAHPALRIVRFRLRPSLVWPFRPVRDLIDLHFAITRSPPPAAAAIARRSSRRRPAPPPRPAAPARGRWC